MEIYSKDISNLTEFERAGYHYTKECESEKYIPWRVNRDTKEWNSAWDKFELWKKKYRTNPDKSKVLSMLSDVDGGKYLWFFNSIGQFQDFLSRYPNKFPEEVKELARFAAKTSNGRAVNA